MAESDQEILIPSVSGESVSRKFSYRWVVLIIFSILSLLQSAVWDTWGPISPSATAVIGFTKHDYFLLSNWAPIGIMPTIPIFIWLFNRYGTRIPVVIGCGLVAIGTGLRCLPLVGLSRIVVIHAGQFFSAVAGCVVLGAAPLISNMWFPSHERILATSVMICVGNTGNALSYLVGPAIVDVPENNTCPNSSSTASPVQSSTYQITYHIGNESCETNTDEMEKQIDAYLYGEFGLALVTLLSAIIFYRNKPSVPPSISAAEQRLDVLAGLRQLSKNFSYWMQAFSFAMVNGAYYGWYGVVTVLLKPHHVSEHDVAQAAFIATMVGTAVGVIVGWFSDRMKGRVKWILFVCYCLMFLTFLFIVIMIMEWFEAIKFSYGGFLASFILLGTLSNLIQPLGFELAADIGYPVNEGPSASILAWLIMLFMFIFLLTLNTLPDGKQDVANYIFLAFVGVAAPVLAFSTKNENVRVTVDLQEDGNIDHGIQNSKNAESPENNNHSE